MLHIERYMRYKVFRKFENVYIRYLGAEGSIDPILLMVVTHRVTDMFGKKSGTHTQNTF